MADRFRAAVKEFIRRPRVTRFFSHALPPIDKAVRRLTGGRVTSVGDWLFPTLVLRSTGAKSGLPREHTLVYIEDDEGRPVLVGTNFGGENHPAWTYNLLANPGATVEIRDRTHHVTAVPLGPDEQAAHWPRFDAVYPGYASYRERIGDTREIRMFRLDPA